MKFGWAAYVIPLLFVFSPALLLIGEPWEITIAIVTATFGVWLVSASLAGFFASELSAAMRLLFAVFGLLALVPAGMFEGAAWTDLAGAGGGLILMIANSQSSKKQRLALEKGR